MAVKVYSMVYHCWYQRFLTKGSACQVFHGRSSLLSCCPCLFVCQVSQYAFCLQGVRGSLPSTSAELISYWKFFFSKVICVSPTPSSLSQLSMPVSTCRYGFIHCATMLLSLVSEAFSIGSSVHLIYHLQWVCLVRDISLWTHRDTTDSSQGFSKPVLDSALSLLRAGSFHWIMALEMAVVTPWGKQSL